jgi:hypothetical protein
MSIVSPRLACAVEGLALPTSQKSGPNFFTKADDSFDEGYRDKTGMIVPADDVGWPAIMPSNISACGISEGLMDPLRRIASSSSGPSSSARNILALI